MHIDAFITKYRYPLDKFVELSRQAGARTDFVQGGGGNTSCKLDGSLMVIKASGYRLKQMSRTQAYVIVDHPLLAGHFRKTDPAETSSPEQDGENLIRSAVRPVEGLGNLRPSVEAGFHSLLDRYVLHTHPVYANLAMCSAEGPSVSCEALKDMEYGSVFIPYADPGTALTAAVNKAINGYTGKKGTIPAVILMQNHGLIVSHADADECLRLHDEVNVRIAEAFGVSEKDWPDISLEPAREECISAWQSGTAWLREHLARRRCSLERLVKQPLYPDQLVYLGSSMDIIKEGTLKEWLESEAKGTGGRLGICTVFSETGEVYYRCGENEAYTMEETLCAAVFIEEAILNAGMAISAMGEKEQKYITGWESEKYRKTVAER